MTGEAEPGHWRLRRWTETEAEPALRHPVVLAIAPALPSIAPSMAGKERDPSSILRKFSDGSRSPTG
jgi:hypothetical protein